MCMLRCESHENVIIVFFSLHQQRVAFLHQKPQNAMSSKQPGSLSFSNHSSVGCLEFAHLHKLGWKRTLRGYELQLTY